MFVFVLFCFVMSSFDPTIEVVTFRLRGWCVLRVFLLPALFRLGHGCQDLLSPCDGMLAVYTLIQKSPRKKSHLPEAERRVEPATLHHAATVSPTHYRLSYSGHVDCGHL